MADPTSLVPGVGGSGGLDLLTGAASASLPNQEAIQAQANQLIQALTASRLGASGNAGITYGPELPHPIMPTPPQGTPGPGIPQGSFQTTGERKRADKQALFGTIADIVRGAEKKHYANEVQKLQHDFEIMSGAIKGYNEAQASGNKEMMKHNADIINGIVSDPKKAKALAKAFDVNLNPLAQQKKKEKPNPAQDAMRAAFAKDTQDFASKKTMLAPQAQALMRNIPQTAQMDPRLAIIEQLTKSGVLPKAGDELTFQKDLLEINQRIQNNQVTNETKLKLGKMLGEGMLNRSNIAANAAIARTFMTVQGAKDRQDVILQAWKYRADKQLEGINNKVSELKDRFSGKNATTNDKKFSNFINELDKKGKLLNQQLSAAVKAHNTDDIKRINKEIDSLVIMQGLASAEAAKRVGLNPEDFNQEGYQLSPEEQGIFNQLFQSNEENAAGADNQ